MERFLIDTPPPTISGNLHMGHIFSYTQGDIIAQYQRYKGKELIYPFCFDNNGIPTGKLASSKGITSPQEIKEFSEQRGKEYEQLFKDCGLQFGNQRYSTYDPNAIKLAYKAFHKLKDEGIIYYGETEYLYSPKQKCSISQSELNDEGFIERSGELPEIKKGWGWFINIKDHINEIKDRINQIEWKPEKYKQRAIDWCDNIKWDWSISRERHFGIPIPGESNMTFDTWFISSLSPQLAYGEGLKCPIFDMRFQSHDIIRTWAFYTIAMSHFLNNQIPWKTIMITGHTLDGKGDKFSKSAGNATTPKPLLERYGSSGLRYWSASNTMGTDTKIDEEKMKMGWRLENKMTNAKKFIQMQMDNGWTGEDNTIYEEYLIHKKEILDHFENYELDKVLDGIYTFFWNLFCDKWIEWSKKESISLTLKRILEDFEPIFKIIIR